MTIIRCSINEPIRKGLTWNETWISLDQGLIKAWEVGRQNAEKDELLRQKAIRNELPTINTWKGYLHSILKVPQNNVSKYGTLKY